MRTLLLRTATALALAGMGLVLHAPGASALSCVDPTEWYPDAEHVFVARIADVDGPRLQLQVREVWQGDDLAERVWVRRDTGLDMWFAFNGDGEIEDGYSSPTEYVVAAQEDLMVGPCSLASVDGSGYGVPGAEEPRAPVSEGEDGRAAAVGVQADQAPSIAPLAAGGAGVLGLGALVGFLGWRRRP
jgi:hypothetical protein